MSLPPKNRDSLKSPKEYHCKTSLTVTENEGCVVVPVELRSGNSYGEIDVVVTPSGIDTSLGTTINGKSNHGVYVGVGTSNPALINPKVEGMDCPVGPNGLLAKTT